MGRLVFAEDYARDKKLVQYVLANLHMHSNPTPSVDFEKFSIEHLTPQSKITTDEELEVFGSIGNLLYVDAALNELLGDRGFAAKKKILAGHQTNYDLDDVLAASSWDDAAIEERGRRLAALAYDKVWHLPSTAP